jgi:TPR repeat protein
LSRKFCCFVLLLLATVPEAASTSYLPLVIGAVYDHPGASAESVAHAFGWYEIAARQHNTEAALLVGTCYLTARGVAFDPERAMQWLELAAAGGEPRAEAVLGNVFCGGLPGVRRNPAMARFWWMRAIAHGSTEARDNASEESCTSHDPAVPLPGHDI